MTERPVSALCSAVILAGGESRRMGRDKAWIEWQGKPLIQRAVDLVRDLGVHQVLLSGRAESDYGPLRCPVLHDLEPRVGPLSGIERGLQACASPLLLVLAVDLPDLSLTLLRKLVHCCDPLTGVVPLRHGRLEPLVAVYPKRCHAFAQARMIRGACAVHDFATDCHRERAVRYWRVPASLDAVFRNCNQPQDLGLSNPRRQRRGRGGPPPPAASRRRDRSGRP